MHEFRCDLFCFVSGCDDKLTSWAHFIDIFLLKFQHGLVITTCPCVNSLHADSWQQCVVLIMLIFYRPATFVPPLSEYEISRKLNTSLNRVLPLCHNASRFCSFAEPQIRAEETREGFRGNQMKVSCGFPIQMAPNAGNISVSWRQHVLICISDKSSGRIQPPR